jgi:hypothetical protein
VLIRIDESSVTLTPFGSLIRTASPLMVRGTARSWTEKTSRDVCFALSLNPPCRSLTLHGQRLDAIVVLKHKASILKVSHEHAGRVNTKSINQAAKGCAIPVGLVTGGLGSRSRCFDPDD